MCGIFVHVNINLICGDWEKEQLEPMLFKKKKKEKNSCTCLIWYFLRVSFKDKNDWDTLKMFNIHIRHFYFPFRETDYLLIIYWLILHFLLKWWGLGEDEGRLVFFRDVIICICNGNIFLSLLKMFVFNFYVG